MDQNKKRIKVVIQDQDQREAEDHQDHAILNVQKE
jgi:hypothetical protein